MKYTFGAIALAACSLASPVPDNVAAAPPSFKIANIISGGSGCPQGTIDINFTDNKILPIYFNKEFTAAIGPGVAADQQRKNCQINMKLQYSPGYQYAVYSADYVGYGDLDAGVKGTVKANYYFSGQTDQVSSALQLQGPFTGRYTKHDDVALSIWSPCGSDSLFNVNSEVFLTTQNSGASGTLVATKESARFQQNLFLKWRQC